MQSLKCNTGFAAFFISVVLFLTLFNQSVAQINDSITIYTKIKKVADRSRFTTFIYNAVFVDPKPVEYSSEPASDEPKIVNPYLVHDNKTIRKINILVYDPFGYSVNDTTKQNISKIQKFGNSLHVTTFKRVIKARLLFRENEPLNALALSESERLIRQSGFVNDAKLMISESAGKDSVDVLVIVHDKWTVIMPVGLTDVDGFARFKNGNLFGSGNQFEQYVGFTKPDRMDYNGYYNISNIGRTYLSSRFFYVTNRNGTTVGVNAESPFYSPLAKMAGGVNVTRSWKFFSYKDSINSMEKRADLNSILYDLWLGKSIKINSRLKYFDQSTNFIISERFYVNQFDKRPAFSIDTAKKNINSTAIIGSAGFAVQQFYKEKFIYRFGANEDVPQGLVLQLLYGVTENELGKTKYYLGGEIARAKHYKAGYFSALVSSGIFFNKGMNNDITTRIKFNYFSDLIRIGKWYIREFVNSNWVYGMNKPESKRVTLTSDDLYGFESGNLNGTTKAVFNSETIAYAPYNIIGFRFAPALLVGCGIIGDKKNTIDKSNLYQAYALALLVRNENLLSSTFQISIGAYPFFPDGKSNVFKYGPVTSFTLKVNPFTLGRPQFIEY